MWGGLGGSGGGAQAANPPPPPPPPGNGQPWHGRHALERGRGYPPASLRPSRFCPTPNGTLDLFLQEDPPPPRKQLRYAPPHPLRSPVGGWARVPACLRKGVGAIPPPPQRQHFRAEGQVSHSPQSKVFFSNGRDKPCEEFNFQQLRPVRAPGSGNRRTS